MFKALEYFVKYLHTGGSQSNVKNGTRAPFQRHRDMSANDLIEVVLSGFAGNGSSYQKRAVNPVSI